MAYILIEDPLAHCIIGINEDERREKQDVVINMALAHDSRKAGRTTDLDLALYANLVIVEPDLRVPDPDILERAFLAVPLAELATEMLLPGTDDCLADIAARLSREGMAALPGCTTLLRRRLTNKPPES